jgi:hypothetical protein
MDMFGEIHSVNAFNNAVALSDEKSEGHAHHQPPTLEDIQHRACEIHHKHGAVNGGYTLDEWLEAEHELEETDDPDAGNDRVH